MTNNFQRQDGLLTDRDLLAWFYCVYQVDATGFFNSNSVAGASQAHRHMQLIPNDVLRKMRLDAQRKSPSTSDGDSGGLKSAGAAGDSRSDARLKYAPTSGEETIFPVPIYDAVLPKILSEEWLPFDPTQLG